MNFQNFSLPDFATFGSPNSNQTIKVAIKRHFMLQGFTGLDREAKPESLLAASFDGLAAFRPWMLSYLPSGQNGFSGGPVIAVAGPDSEIVGIHVHSYNVMATFNGEGAAGQSLAAVIGVKSGDAVPISYLLAAIALAPPGDVIVDVPM